MVESYSQKKMVLNIQYLGFFGQMLCFNKQE